MQYISLRVMNMVRRALVQNPEMTNEALYSAAVALDPDIGKLTMRQFHARYPLQVRRRELGALAAPRPRSAEEAGVVGSTASQNGDQGAKVLEPVVETETEESSTPWPIEFWPEAATVRPAPEPPRQRKRKRRKRKMRVAGRRAGVAANGARDQVRAVLIGFAAAVAAAETASDMVDALASIDDTVAAAIAAARN